MSAFFQALGGIPDEAHGRPHLLMDCAGLAGGQAEIPVHVFSRLECLFTGELARELKDVGPYLGELHGARAEHLGAVDNLLIQQVAALVLPKAHVPADECFVHLHRHFRKLNVVYGPEGQPLFFRYYDPRVVLDVLGTFDVAQLDLFFGPIERLVVAGEGGRAITCYQHAGRLVITAGAARGG